LQRLPTSLVNFDVFTNCMKNFLTSFFLFLLLPAIANSQTYQSRLKFEQGQKLEITTRIKSHIAQQAMGQAIDFDVDGEALHYYTVTNATADNSTLRHQMKQVSFNFDGMGQKRSFNSNNEKDMSGQFGAPVKGLLDKSFDMIIGPNGTVLLVQPEKIEFQTDERTAIITNMLKKLFEVAQPPIKGGGCLFKTLPDTAVTTGSAWIDSLQNESGKYVSNYTISSITDTTITIAMICNSVTTERSEMMGNEIITTMNNKSTGTIIVDRATGIIREKNILTESNGNSEIMGGTLPVNSKTTITMTVHR
jgi:hypothetical protein